MKHLSFFILIMLGCAICKGQGNLGYVFVVRTDYAITRTSNLILDHDDTWEFYSGPKIDSLVPDKRSGMMVTFNHGIRLIGLTALFDKYGIDTESRALPLYINGAKILKSSDLLIQEKMVDVVNKENDHLNIITRALLNDHFMFLCLFEGDAPLRHIAPTLYIVKMNGKEIRTPNLIIDHQSIQDMKTFRGKEAEAFGVDKTYTVSVVVLNPTVQLVDVSTLFGKYVIDEKTGLLPKRVDGFELFNSKDIIVEENAVKRIRKEANYIDIITVN